MEEIVFSYLSKSGQLPSDLSDIAINNLTEEDGSIVLSGNSMGLILLADYLVAVALKETSSHIHLDGHNFFDNANMQLVIEKVAEVER